MTGYLISEMARTSPRVSSMRLAGSLELAKAKATRPSRWQVWYVHGNAPPVLVSVKDWNNAWKDKPWLTRKGADDGE